MADRSAARHGSILRALTSLNRFPTADDARTILSSHAGRPEPICRHRDPGLSWADQRETLATLWFDTDATAYAREHARTTALPASDRRSALSLRDLINRTFERVGRRDGDIRRLTRVEILQAIFGEEWAFEQSRLVSLTLAEMGATRDGDEFIWRARVSAATRSDDRSILAEFGTDSGLERIVRQHMVRAHLRRYSPRGYQRNASPKKIADYPAARRAFGDGTWPPALLANTTWVAPYEAGAEQEYSRDQLALMTGTGEDDESESD